jgi:hypothetical protein
MISFCYEIINNPNYRGDIIEFGTGSGNSTMAINALLLGSRKIITFDGFKGLPKTNKVIPQNTGWHEGNIFCDEHSIREKLKEYKNITVIATMTSDLKDPGNYGISKIAGVNMDLDLYEGTIDALRFIDKCDWENLIIRFDDWGAYSFQIPEEVDQHEKAAFYEFVNERKYNYFFYKDYTELSNNLQALIKISR